MIWYWKCALHGAVYCKVSEDTVVISFILRHLFCHFILSLGFFGFFWTWELEKWAHDRKKLKVWFLGFSFFPLFFYVVWRNKLSISRCEWMCLTDSDHYIWLYITLLISVWKLMDIKNENADLAFFLHTRFIIIWLSVFYIKLIYE